MFSGLTNQVSSMWSNAKGAPTDEEVPTPPPSQTTAPEIQETVQEPAAAPVSEETPVEGGQSPTKGGIGMFSNAKSSLTGWMSNASASIPTVSMPSMPNVSMPSMPSIPGLKKAAPTDETQGDGSVQTELAAEPQIVGGDEDDRSSATGGADSRPLSERASPTEEQAAGVGNVTTKITAGAKSMGSFLFGAVNKAGAKIKETVKDNPILGEFNKEQEAFIKGQSGKSTEAGVCPWVGHTNEEKIKEEILSLSADRRNFVRAPPAGVDFEFDYDTAYPVALAIMTEDTALEKMRFELVPKIITEENFWRNYFYRVQLIIQAGDLGTLGTDNAFGQRDEDVTKPSNSSADQVRPDPTARLSGEELPKLKRASESEFISDKFVTNEKDLQDINDHIKKLGIDSLASDAKEASHGKADSKGDSKPEVTDEEQWEKDLEAELQDFEVVNDGKVTDDVLFLDTLDDDLK